MFVLINGRRQGKTTAVVGWYLEKPYHRNIIVRDRQDEDRLIHQIGRACNYRLEVARVRRNIYSIQEFTNLRRIRDGGEWAIDDLDRVLEALLGGPVELVTSTGTLIAPAPSRPNDYIDGDVVAHWDDKTTAIRELDGRPTTASIRKMLEK